MTRKGNFEGFLQLSERMDTRRREWGGGVSAKPSENLAEGPGRNCTGSDGTKDSWGSGCKKIIVQIDSRQDIFLNFRINFF